MSSSCHSRPLTHNSPGKPSSRQSSNNNQTLVSLFLTALSFLCISNIQSFCISPLILLICIFFFSCSCSLYVYTRLTTNLFSLPHHLFVRLLHLPKSPFFSLSSGSPALCWSSGHCPSLQYLSVSPTPNISRAYP